LAFEIENEAIHALGVAFDLLDFEALIEGRTEYAVRRLPGANVGLLVYRGWMLPVAIYAQLAAAIEARGGHLLNDAASYETLHHLPNSYAMLDRRTPKTTWISGAPPFATDEIHSAITAFGDGPIVVKDFVKSRKHEWADAFFIRSASDLPEVDRVVSNFVSRQGEDIAGGLVFREFVELDTVGTHPSSGLALGREYRLFFLDRELLASGRYWEEVEYDDDFEVDQFAEIARSIASRFFSMDVARTRAGDWIVIEVGDGQVSGLPRTFDPMHFYRSLISRLD
jgi:hypothetical protein